MRIIKRKMFNKALLFIFTLVTVAGLSLAVLVNGIKANAVDTYTIGVSGAGGVPGYTYAGGVLATNTGIVQTDGNQTSDAQSPDSSYGTPKTGYKSKIRNYSLIVLGAVIVLLLLRKRKNTRDLHSDD